MSTVTVEDRHEVNLRINFSSCRLVEYTVQKDYLSTIAMKTITSITVSDVEKRRLPSKHYVYVIFVRWSDGGQYVIYRRYSRFFDLQSTLLDKFPIEAGTIDPTQRILPILPGKILFGRSHIREVAVKRLKPIEAYCKALIALPASISHCEDVLDFFQVDDDDLEPPCDELRKIAKPKAEKISKPKELKRLVAVEDYRKEDRGEIDLRAGQVVELVEQSHSGWWFVNAEDEQGWVPSTFLQSLEGEKEDTVSKKTGAWYVCVADYTAGSQDELSLHKGDVLQVLETNMHGWWHVTCHGMKGLAPATYLTKLQDKESSSVAEKGRVSGVEIISSLSQISDLLNQDSQQHKSSQFWAETTWQAGGIKAGAGRETGGLRAGAERETCGLRAGTERQTGGLKAGAERQADWIEQDDLYSKVNKIRSLERGGSLRPPPRQHSIEKVVVKLGPQRDASGYSTRADFCDLVGDGISFKANEAVKVLERAAGGWWFVQIRDQEGWAPASYIQPTPQVEQTVNQLPQSENKTALYTACNKPQPVNNTTHLSDGKHTVPNKQTLIPKQVSSINCCGNKDRFEEKRVDNKSSSGSVDTAVVHQAPSSPPSGVVVTLLPTVAAPQTTARNTHLLAKPTLPLKPTLSKVKSNTDPPKVQTKSTLKENTNSPPGEPNMQGTTASLKAKFEKIESNTDVSLTCLTTKHSKSAAKFTKGEKIATKPKLPVKPFGKSFAKDRQKLNGKSREGICESVNVNALVSSLSGELHIGDQQICMDRMQVHSGLDAKTQLDRMEVRSGLDAKTQLDRMEVRSGLDAKTQLDRMQVHSGLDAKTQLDRMPVCSGLDAREVQAKRTSLDDACRSSIYTSICEFTAEQDGEVSFAEGERITVLERPDGGWWLVSLSNGREGWVPAAFLSKS